MERIEFDYPAAKRGILKKAHVGVVGSGDMEVLLAPSPGEGAQYSLQPASMASAIHGRLCLIAFSQNSTALYESTSTMRAQHQEAYCFAWNRQWR